MLANLPVTGVSTKFYAISHGAVCLLPATHPAKGIVGVSLTVTLATATFASSYAPEAYQSQTKTRGTIRTPVTSKWELPDTLKQLTHLRQPPRLPPKPVGKGHRDLTKRSSLLNPRGRFVHVGSTVVVATCLAHGLLAFARQPSCPQSSRVAQSSLLPPRRIVKREMNASNIAAPLVAAGTKPKPTPRKCGATPVLLSRTLHQWLCLHAQCKTPFSPSTQYCLVAR